MEKYKINEDGANGTYVCIPENGPMYVQLVNGTLSSFRNLTLEEVMGLAREMVSMKDQRNRIQSD